MNVLLRLLLVASLVVGASCGEDSSGGGWDSAKSDPSPTPSAPAWERIEPGVHAYTVDDVEACPTVTDFTRMMQSETHHCQFESPAQVMIHKTRQDPGIFGGDAIYVIAKRWSGLVQDSKLVPIIPKGTRIQCAENDGEYGLFDHTYQYDGETIIGRSAFKAVVAHTLELDETQAPFVTVLSGGGKGKSGYLKFDDMEQNCTIEGSSFKLGFDWYQYEQDAPMPSDSPQ